MARAHDGGAPKHGACKQRATGSNAEHTLAKGRMFGDDDEIKAFLALAMTGAQDWAEDDLQDATAASQDKRATHVAASADATAAAATVPPQGIRAPGATAAAGSLVFAGDGIREATLARDCAPTVQAAHAAAALEVADVDALEARISDIESANARAATGAGVAAESGLYAGADADAAAHLAVSGGVQDDDAHHGHHHEHEHHHHAGEEPHAAEADHHAQPNHIMDGHNHLDHLTDGHTHPNHVANGHVAADHVAPVHAHPNHVTAVHAHANHVVANHAYPNHVAASHAHPDHVVAGHANLDHVTHHANSLSPDSSVPAPAAISTAPSLQDILASSMDMYDYDEDEDAEDESGTEAADDDSSDDDANEQGDDEYRSGTHDHLAASTQEQDDPVEELVFLSPPVAQHRLDALRREFAIAGAPSVIETPADSMGAATRLTVYVDSTIDADSVLRSVSEGV